MEATLCICPTCQQTFEATRPKQRFCTRACANRRDTPVSLVVCPTCQQSFQPNKPTQRFCTQACAARRHKLAARVCPTCEQSFQPKTTSQQYCSHACSYHRGLQALATWRASGQDPAHGGKAKELRQAALSKRRTSSGELLPVPPLLTETVLHTLQAAYSASGVRYERLMRKQEHRKAPLGPLSAPSRPPLGPLLGGRGQGVGGRGNQPDAFLVLSGYGASLRVSQHALVVYPGRTHSQQQATTQTYYRGLPCPEQILMLKEMPGSLSLDAIIWCKEQGINLHILDIHGASTQTLPAKSETDILLRRQQYAASGSGHSVALARVLVERKIRAQLHTLHLHAELPRGKEAIRILTDALTWFEMQQPPPWLERLDILTTYEARAAHAYFAAWGGLSLTWEKKKQVPPHWQAIRERGSPRSFNARHAIDPCNTLLNYAYAVLESQCRQALIASGFDTACGVLHADQPGRDSLVYDLMELYRPLVDHQILTLLHSTVLRLGDMTPTKTGEIRLHPEFARYVVARCRLPQQDSDAGALWLKSAFMNDLAPSRPPLGPL